MEIIIIMVALVFPLGWLVSEGGGYVVARRVFGALTIVSACLIGWGVGMLQQFNYNAWYGRASKELLEGVAGVLPPESAERKILEEGAQNFHPTYENRARYDLKVDSILKSLPKNVPAENEKN